MKTLLTLACLALSTAAAHAQTDDLTAALPHRSHPAGVVQQLNKPTQTTMLASFNIEDIECGKTTEAGEDETYVLLIYKFGGANGGTERVPSDDGHWDMNDGADDQNRHVKPGKVIGFNLEDGGSVDMIVQVMEEDGGDGRDFINFGNGVIAACGITNPYVLGGAALATVFSQFFHIQDTDDWIGSFSVHIERNGDQISWKYQPVARCIDPAGEMTNMSRGWVHLNGDGSDYGVTFSITNE
ncbi:MAG: hypothetical protein JWP94_488 [Mucilaginibacter sp.]|nr:hypothetical protein [Mucilaginibacter sp.]